MGMDLQWTILKVHGPKNTVSKLMDLNDTPTKVNGPPVHFTKVRTQCRELPLCVGSGEGCQWQALPSPVQCEETATRTRDLPVTDGKTLPLAPGPPFCYNILTLLIYYAINWNCELPLQAMRSVQGEIHKQPIYKQMITIRKWRSLLHRIFAMQMHITSLKMECTICNKLELQITVTGNEKCPKVRYI